MFHAIKPLAELSPSEIRALAQAAAERDDAEHNPYPPGTDKHGEYQRAYQQRCAELCAA